MSGAAFLKLKKLTGSGIIGKAARHNRRVIQAELGASGPIDVTRSHLNITLMGPSTADEVAKLAKAKMMAAGITKDRKNGVMGVELVFSLPTDHTHDVTTYFTASAQWAGAQFGGMDNIVSVDIHRDEAQDHAHVLLVPLFEGRLRGSDAVGNKRKLSELQTNFYNAVAAGFGFSKPRARLSGNNKAQITRQVLDRLRQDPVAKSAAWAVIRDSVERDPQPYALALGITITVTPNKPAKTMRQIFTGNGKGPRKEKPIGFQTGKPYRVSGGADLQTLGHCRESISKQQSKAPEAPAPQSTMGGTVNTKQHEAEQPGRQAAELGQIVRIRECDFPAGSYDPDTGDFYPQIPARKSAKAEADHWVREALHGAHG
ncbi:plasmid recombination protein [Limnohabitans sp. DM1]|uniref:plasmid recombination protein n=1 Tax=Limnohabitans sp. DM1 TaxID=1597955 RepID=UPI000ADFBD40|nr:plasmid recombination protein [Limnohabitans sp. DM1]